MATEEPSAGDRATSSARRFSSFSRDQAFGFAALACSFCAALAISWKASRAVQPDVAVPPGPPSTEGLAGFPESVDPAGSLARARALTRRRDLRRVLATGVDARGVVDLTQPGAGVRYEFASKRGEGPEPPRRPGSPRLGSYCGRQVVALGPEGLVAEPDQPRARCPGEPREALPPPACSLAALVALAAERGAEAGKRATIEYYLAQAGPAYRVSIPGSPVRFAVGGDCAQALEGQPARPR